MFFNNDFGNGHRHCSGGDNLYEPLVEANQEYHHSFRTYCSQHKGSFVLNTKGLLFSSIYVNIVLFLTQRVFCFQVFMSILYCSQHKGSFVFKHLCKYCIVLNTKGLLFPSICVNIVLFATQRSFVFKHLCRYCIVLDTRVVCFQVSV